MKRFVDTNVLLYSIGMDAAEEAKRLRARDLLLKDDLAFSVQVLQEFYSQATSARFRGSLTHEAAVNYVQIFCTYPVQEMTIELLMAALSAKQRFHISYWDAAIIEAARALGCATLLSEDLNHGQNYDGVRVVNPFLA